MKNVAYLFVSLIVFSTHSFSQTTKLVLKTYQIIEERNIALNGGIRSQFGGKSRTYIKIDLPPGTKEWYYSFSTRPGTSGTENLNLALQLSTLVTGGLASSAINTAGIKIPSGSASIDVYLLSSQWVNSFLEKADTKGVSIPIITEGSVQNTRQAAVKIDDVKEGTWYLALKNPSETDGINIFIEVVAIVEEKMQASPEETKAIFYGNLGWKAYDRGDYDQCLELSKKAIEIYPDLGYVWANVGLVQLIKGDYITAVESYAKAMELYKAIDKREFYIRETIKDIDNAIKKHGDLQGAKDIRDSFRL